MGIKISCDICEGESAVTQICQTCLNKAKGIAIEKKERIAIRFHSQIIILIIGIGLGIIFSSFLSILEI